MPRPCTAAVQSLLDNWNPRSRNAICDLYTFTLAGGEVLRYSGWQKAIRAPAPETDSPLVAFPLGPPIKRNKTKVQIGVQVDVLEIDVYASANLALSGGAISWQDAMRGGLFDGAYCSLWRCFMSPPGTVVGTIAWFYGRVADVDIGRTAIKIQVKSLLDLLTAQMPRRLFQAACTHVFGDAMCGYDRAVDGAAGPGGGGPAYAQDITCTVGTLQSQIHYADAAPDPATLFNNGTLVGLTGANAGYKRSITQIIGGVVYLLDPWIFPVEIGDTFTLLPGCDHTLATCDGTFGNLPRFGGFPYIPPPESAA